MNIDVLINSCARPDILEESIKTFMERVKVSCDLRYVLLEDRVNNVKRQKECRNWIEEHSYFFDVVKYADKKMGPGNFFAPIVSMCKSDYFFHLEDDNEFIVDIDLDGVLDVMQYDNSIVEVILNRGIKNGVGKTKTINDLYFTEFKMFSVATGLFNTQQLKRIISKIGWNNTLHETKLMSPISDSLNLKRYILGNGDKHYVHVGETKNYRKGNWKY